jgi:hypothetical protein
METPISDRPHHFLAIYLNDHLAGATVGVELARRLRGSNRDHPDFGEPLASICAAIEVDRTTLEEVMEELGIDRSRLKPAGAWLGEKLGRLKLNGQLRGYSPLSRMVELEGLCIGIDGKTQLWRALAQALPGEQLGFDFNALAERAAGQRQRVQDLHLHAAAAALGENGRKSGRSS